MKAFLRILLRKLRPEKISVSLFILTTALCCLSVFVVAFFLDREGKDLLLQEKSNKLYAIAQSLDLLLGDAYEEIDPALGKEQQIAQLNRMLSGKIEQLLQLSPDIGAGYYHKKLDAIILYAPHSRHGDYVGRPIERNHRGRSVMESGTKMIDIGLQVRGNIMNAMLPIIRNGEILGYIWANETLDDIEKQTLAFDLRIGIVSLICIFGCILITSFLSKKINNDIAVIKTGLQKLPFDLDVRIPSLHGEIDEISKGINTLADRLKKARSMNELILENTLDGVITVDTEGDIITLNPAAEKMTGYKLVDVVGKPYSSIIDHNNFKSPLLDTLFSGADHNSVEVDFPVSGRVIRISASTAHLKDYDGTVLGALVFFKDITEKKEMDRLILQTERLVVVGELMAGIAHEIRNPLAAVRGFVQYLERDPPKESRAEFIKIILKEVDSINNIIQHLLDLSAPSKNYYVSCSLNSLIEEVLTLIKTSHRFDNIETIFDIDRNLPEIYADKELIKQSLLNIILNSIQAIEDKGIIAISTFLTENGKYQTIRIIDNGEGIKSDLLGKIYTPFFTTKKAGTGLGLPMVQKTISSHKGKIAIRNNPDQKGVIVEISLPAL